MTSPYRLRAARDAYDRAAADVVKWRQRNDGSFVGRLMVAVAEWNAAVALHLWIVMKEGKR